MLYIKDMENTFEVRIRPPPMQSIIGNEKYKKMSGFKRERGNLNEQKITLKLSIKKPLLKMSLLV